MGTEAGHKIKEADIIFDVIISNEEYQKFNNFVNVEMSKKYIRIYNM